MNDAVEETVDDKAGVVDARIVASVALAVAVAVAIADAAAKPFDDEAAAAAAACADFDAVDLSILVLEDIFAINGKCMDA